MKNILMSACVFTVVFAAGGAAARAETTARAASQPASRPAELGDLTGPAPLVRIIALLDGSLLEKLKLPDETLARARATLRTWYVDDLANARGRTAAELANADPARQAHLRTVLADQETPYRCSQTLASYRRAAAALKPILTDQQLTALDALVRQATVDMVVNHYILGQVASWKKDGVVLAANQQAGVEAVIAVMKARTAALPAGDERGVRQVLGDLSNQLPALLTPDQRRQTMHVTP